MQNLLFDSPAAQKGAPAMTATDHIEQAARTAYLETFTAECRERFSYDEMRADALGDAVAFWAEWDGVMIMEVAAAALTDANFHTEAAMLETVIAKYADAQI